MIPIPLPVRVRRAAEARAAACGVRLEQALVELASAAVTGMRMEGRPVVTPAFEIVVLKRFEFRVSAETEDEAKALAVVVASGNASEAVRSRCRCVGRRLAVERCEPAAPLAAPSA